MVAADDLHGIAPSRRGVGDDHNPVVDRGMAFFFVMAGLDTLKAAIGFAFQHLATKPELRQRLIDDPEDQSLRIPM